MQANSGFDTFQSSVGLMRWAESAQRPHISVTALALVGLDLLSSVQNRGFDSDLLYRRSVILRSGKTRRKKISKFFSRSHATKNLVVRKCLA